MHDELGAKLTKIAFFGELATRSPGNAQEAFQHLEHVKRMSREAARALNEMVWAVKPSNDTLPSLASFLCQYATEYLEPTSIRARFDLQRNLDSIPIGADIRHNIFLLFKEALTNVVKHSQATEVRIRLQMEEDVIRLQILDDGTGLLDSSGTVSLGGNGLGNMRQRAQEIGRELTVTNRSEGGLAITLKCRLPVNKIEQNEE